MHKSRLDELLRLQEQGGLAKGTALIDFPQDGNDVLMFLKGDEVVLLEDGPQGTWGFCEGVVGRFKLSHVRFPTSPTTSPSTDTPPASSSGGAGERRRALRPSFPSNYSLASSGSLASLAAPAADGAAHSDASPSSPFLARLEQAAKSAGLAAGVVGPVEELREFEDGEDSAAFEGADGDRSQVILDLSPVDDPAPALHNAAAAAAADEPFTPKSQSVAAFPSNALSALAGVILPPESLPRTPGEDSTFEFDSSSSSTLSDSVASFPLPPASQRTLASQRQDVLDATLPITVTSPTATNEGAGRSWHDRSFESQASEQGRPLRVVSGNRASSSSRPLPSIPAPSRDKLHPSRPTSPDDQLRRDSDPSSEAASTRSSTTQQSASGRRSPDRTGRRSSAPSSPAGRLPPRPAKSPSRKRANGKSPGASASSSSTTSPASVQIPLPTPSSSSASLAALGLPTLKSVRTSSPAFSTSLSSSTISSDGRAEYEVGEIFDAYGRESMYLPPEGWTWETATPREKQRMSRALNGLEMTLGEKADGPVRTKVDELQRKKRQSMMAFNAVQADTVAPPLPTIPSLSNSTQTSVETADDSPATPTAPLVSSPDDFGQTPAAMFPLPLSPDAESPISPVSLTKGGTTSLGATLLGLTSPITSPESGNDSLSSPPAVSASFASNPLSLASDLRQRIRDRSERDSPATSMEGGEQEGSEDEVVLAGELAKDRHKDETGAGIAAPGVGGSVKSQDQDSWRVAATARSIPSLSTNTSRTPPALKIDTGRLDSPAASLAPTTGSREPSTSSTIASATSSKDAFYGRPTQELGASPGPVPISFFVGNQTSGVYSRTAFGSMSPSPPSTPKGLHPPPVSDKVAAVDHASLQAPAAGLYLSSGAGSNMAPPRPAFFASRPRSQSFSGLQTVEIGFPIHSTSPDSPSSFTTLSSSPKSPPGGINSRPSLTSLGIGASVAVPEAPFMQPALERRGSDRSPLSAPPTVAPPAEKSPRSAATSRFEQLQVLPRPFKIGTTDRSVSSKAALPSQEPQVTSPTSTETGGKKGFKGFFIRARSKSDARPPSNKGELEALQRPLVPMATAPPPNTPSPIMPSAPFSRSTTNSSPKPSVASIDTQGHLPPPLPPPLEQPSSPFSIDSSAHSPTVRTPTSSAVFLPSALSAEGKTPATLVSPRSPHPAPRPEAPPQQDEQPLQTPRRPSGRSASQTSSLVSSRSAETPKSIFKSPKSTSSKSLAPAAAPPSPALVPPSPAQWPEKVAPPVERPVPAPSQSSPEPRSPIDAPARSPVLSQPSSAARPPPRKPSGPPPETDDFGFYLRNGQRRLPPLPLPPADADQKWTTIISASSPAAALKDKKTRKLVRAGLPPALRGQIWAFFADVGEKRQPGQFARLLEESESTEVMEKDVESAFRDHAYFNEPNTGELDLLNVMKAYTKFNTRLAYQPTLVTIAGVTLLQSSPSESLYLVAAIADKLKGYYDKALQIDALVWVYLLEAVDKTLARYLIIDCHIDMNKVLTRWLLPMFVRVLPFATVLRVWDLFFVEGLTYLLRVALAIIVVNKPRLLDQRRMSSPQAVEQFLFSPPQDALLAPDVLLAAADAIKVPTTDEAMKKWRKKAVDTLISSRAAQAERERKAARFAKPGTVRR